MELNVSSDASQDFLFLVGFGDGMVCFLCFHDTRDASLAFPHCPFPL